MHGRAIERLDSRHSRRGGLVPAAHEVDGALVSDSQKAKPNESG